MNYVLLSGTARLSGLTGRPGRLAWGAAAGSLYAVLIFLPGLGFFGSMAAKLLFSCGLIALTFRIRNVRLYIKTLGFFYLLTFSLGGGILAVISLTGIGASFGAVIRNGVLYMDIPWTVLFGAFFLAYTLIRLVWKNAARRLMHGNALVRLGITVGEREVWMSALVDTGNALCDPITGVPVIVAEYKEIAGLFPEENEKTGSDADMAEKLGKRFRMIPFTSLGKKHGMLPAFRPDSAVILEKDNMRKTGDTVVAITRETLAKDGSFAALIHPGLLSE